MLLYFEMRDNDNSEIPQIPDPSEPPQPKDNMWDVFNRMKASKKPLDEGDLNYVPGQETPPPTDEERMKAAAIKCAEMEDEIVNLLFSFDIPKGNPMKVTTKLSEKVFIWTGPENNQRAIKSLAESILLPNGKPAEVLFNEGLTFEEPVDQDKAEELGITTGRTLSIGLCSDEQVRDAYNAFMETYPAFERTDTNYYFTKDGKYLKVVQLDKEVPLDPKRKLLYPPDHDNEVYIFESPMTQHDFEVAGQALTMLKNRLLEAQGESPTSQPPQQI